MLEQRVAAIAPYAQEKLGEAPALLTYRTSGLTAKVGEPAGNARLMEKSRVGRSAGS